MHLQNFAFGRHWKNQPEDKITNIIKLFVFSWVSCFKYPLSHIMFQVSRPGKRYNLTMNGCVKILGTGWKASQILSCFETIMYYVATFLSIFGTLSLKVFPPMACPPMITNFRFCLLPSNQMCFFLNFINFTLASENYSQWDQISAKNEFWMLSKVKKLYLFNGGSKEKQWSKKEIFKKKYKINIKCFKLFWW